MIRNILGHESAILLQNAFPTLEKYIDHIHVLENGKPAKVIDTICDEILENFNQIMKLKRIGINLFFTNIDTMLVINLKCCNYGKRKIR